MGNRPKWPKDDTLDAVWNHHERGLEVLYDLLAAVGQALKGLPDGWQPRSAQKVAVLHLFVRAFKTAQAIYVLFLNGFAQDAQSLLRSLTEGVIDLLYILQKSGPRARQFAHYMVIGKRDWMRRMKRAFPEFSISPHVEKKIEGDYAALIADRPKYKELNRNWSSAGIEERAREANSKLLYFYYLLSCQTLHSDPRSASSYLRPGEGMDDGPSVPTSQQEGRTLMITYVCLLDAFKAANEVFKWRKGDLVTEFKKRFEREFIDPEEKGFSKTPRPSARGGEPVAPAD